MPVTRARALTALAAALLVLPLPASGQGEEEDRPFYRFGFEVKGHYRDSDRTAIASPFPFPPSFLPVGQTRGFLETVEAGSHAELSVVTLFFEADWGERWAAKAKLDFIDRYDRNPTSEGDEFDVDELWLRWGREVVPGGPLPEGGGVYFKLGKFGKPERQDDRHLESYGLLGTAFNRFEDIGLEIGIDLGRHFYLKGSYSHGNPVFIRDVNALAGDNGIDILNAADPSFRPNPDPELKTGLPILYDTDIDFEDADFENAEAGLVAGWRFGDETGRLVGDVMAWYYRRDLAEEVEFDGTFYGGDLDLLSGPENAGSALPITDDQKREIGLNLWLYLGGFSFFGQYADQELAGLGREGFEVELAWTFDLPFFATVGGHQLFPWIAPAVRYSELDHDFGSRDLTFPAASVFWDWEKTDIGVRLGIVRGVDLTAEYANNEFLLLNGTTPSLDEFLLTLRWGWDRTWFR